MTAFNKTEKNFGAIHFYCKVNFDGLKSSLSILKSLKWLPLHAKKKKQSEILLVFLDSKSHAFNILNVLLRDS